MSPTIHTFEFQAERLKTRTFGTLDTLHFVDEGSRFTCLDLNISAPTLEQLKTLAVQTLQALGPDTILPAAPLDQWRAIWGKPMVWRKALPVWNPRSGQPVAAALVKL